MAIDPKALHIVGLASMTIGYFWLWYFNTNPHVLIKFLTMKAYFLVWLYFLLLVIGKKDIFGYSIQRLFQLNFVLQLVVTPTYWALIHSPMVQSKKFPTYEVMWNIYVHLVPIILLIFQFAISKRQFHNNWQDTIKFYYFFALPVNLLYSHIQRPVYKFLKYDDLGDYVTVFLFGLFITFLHQICYHFFKGWNRRTEQKRAEKIK